MTRIPPAPPDLPDRASTAPPTPPAPPTEPDLVVVLSVEDRPRLQRCVRDMITAALEPFRAVVAVASSVEDAVALLESIRFDLVISDYQLGADHGGQILDYLRKARPQDVERFVFFTGSDEARDLHHKVIDKGIRVSEFISQLRALTRRQIPWPPPWWPPPSPSSSSNDDGGDGNNPIDYVVIPAEGASHAMTRHFLRIRGSADLVELGLATDADEPGARATDACDACGATVDEDQNLTHGASCPAARTQIVQAAADVAIDGTMDFPMALRIHFAREFARETLGTEDATAQVEPADVAARRADLIAGYLAGYRRASQEARQIVRDLHRRATSAIDAWACAPREPTVETIAEATLEEA